jgi:CcmD family protein
MDHLGYLFAANAFVWGGVVFYLFTLRKRGQALKKDLDLLREICGKEQAQ